MSSLRTSAVRGTAASLLSQVVSMVLRLAVIVVFARLLQPADFGLMAMVTSTFAVLEFFTDFGLSTATIQRVSVTQEQLSALFWINLLVGIVLAAIVLAAAWPLAAFYKDPRLGPLTAAFACTFVVSAAGVQHGALLQRQMRFQVLAVIETVSLLLGIAIGLVLAYKHNGYWSLLGMMLGSQGGRTILLWAGSGWLPSAPSKAGGIRSMLNVGGVVTVIGIVMHVAQNLDKVLLGRLFGASSLGFYSRAQQLVKVPTDVINGAVGGVLLSTLSRVKTEPKRVRSYFLKAYSILASITVPTATVVALFATEIIQVVLGDKWSQASPFLRWLAPTVLVFGLMSPMYSLLVTLDLLGRGLRMAFVLAGVMIAGYTSGMYWGGALGAAIGLSSSLIVWCVPHVVWTVRSTPVSVADVAQAVARPFIAAIVATVVSEITLVWWIPIWRSPLKLSVGLATFGFSYVFTLLVILRQWSLFKEVLLSLELHRRPSAKVE